jgi:hypothetical protein
MPSYIVPAANALLTADGGVGIFFVASPFDFKVGAIVRLTSSTQGPLGVIVSGVHPETRAITCLSMNRGYNPDLTAYLTADEARACMDEQEVSENVMPVSIARQAGDLYADVFPSSPDPEVYLPVRLTNGASFYNATGGGGGGGTVDQGQAGTDPWPVTGPLTNAQLRSSAVPVDASGSTVTVVNFPVTQGVSGSLGQGTAAALAGAWPVKLTNGTTAVGVNGDGSLNVTPTPEPSVVVNYNEVTAVASGIETTIIMLSAPPGGMRLTKASASGDNVAMYRLKVDGSTVVTKRSGWTTPNVDFDFDTGLVLTSGQVLVITGYHTRPTTATFEASVVSS